MLGYHVSIFNHFFPSCLLIVLLTMFSFMSVVRTSLYNLCLFFIYANISTCKGCLSVCKKLWIQILTGRVTKYLKNQKCDVIKIREIRGEVGKKTPKKEMENHSLRHRNQKWYTLGFVKHLFKNYFFFKINLSRFIENHDFLSFHWLKSLSNLNKFSVKGSIE